MSKQFSEAFKLNVIKKTVTRSKEQTIDEIAREYGIAESTVRRWVRESSELELSGLSGKEKRPEDWSPAEKLQTIIDCGALDTDAINTYCRKKGLYAHHIKEWKQAMTKPSPEKARQDDKTELKGLKAANKKLKQELKRKEKALAETAALLVLKKKVQQLWESDEDN